MNLGKLPWKIGAKKGDHHPLPEGWKERTYYVVEVAASSHNPIHRAILHVGFISEPDHPLSGGYTEFYNGTWEEPLKWHELYYCKAICEIKEMSDGKL